MLGLIRYTPLGITSWPQLVVESLLGPCIIIVLLDEYFFKS